MRNQKNYVGMIKKVLEFKNNQEHILSESRKCAITAAW